MNALIPELEGTNLAHSLDVYLKIFGFQIPSQPPKERFAFLKLEQVELEQRDEDLLRLSGRDTHRRPLGWRTKSFHELGPVSHVSVPVPPPLHLTIRFRSDGGVQDRPKARFQDRN